MIVFPTSDILSGSLVLLYSAIIIHCDLGAQVKTICHITQRSMCSVSVAHIGNMKQTVLKAVISVNVYFFHPSLRAKYGTSDLKNALHGSESFDAAVREITFMFPNSKYNTHTYCCSWIYVLSYALIMYHPFSLCSYNGALSLKRSNARIPEQIYKPNFARWTRRGVQAQATKSLRRFSILSIYNSCRCTVMILPCYLLLLNVAVTIQVPNADSIILHFIFE